MGVSLSGGHTVPARITRVGRRCCPVRPPHARTGSHRVLLDLSEESDLGCRGAVQNGLANSAVLVRLVFYRSVIEPLLENSRVSECLTRNSHIQLECFAS